MTWGGMDMMRTLRRRLRRFNQKVLKQLDLKEQGAQEATAPKPPVPITRQKVDGPKTW